VERLSHDVILVGGGGAGLRAAIEAARTRPGLDIALLSKVYPMRSHTVSAEGGLAAVTKGDDNLDLHAFDTIRGSDFLADQDAVEFFVNRAKEEVVQLEHWGLPFSRDPDGTLASRAFGGMSVKRTLFAADRIGFHMLHTLFQTSLKYEEIHRYDEWFVTSLLVSAGKVMGVVALDVKTGEMSIVLAKAVILATGGAGRVYEFTTNGVVKTGDGMAMAYRAGCALKDMEFVQFHPTALPGTGILITEAARGEGGHLKNSEGDRFLKNYIPSKMELGPRDILSRAIMTEIKAGRGIQGPYGQYVHLDLTHLGSTVIERKLPMVKELAENYIGIDPIHEPIPVRPAQHYFMGGVSTDVHGQSPLGGLFAAGECAAVSINGANRLGSNSLTECLVFGAEAGRAAAVHASNAAAPNPPEAQALAKQEEERIYHTFLKQEGGPGVADLRARLRHTMEEYVGIYRTEEGLLRAKQALAGYRGELGTVTVEDKSRTFNTDLLGALELDWMVEVADCITTAALARRESRGSHSRTDHPKRDDTNYLKHYLVMKSNEGPILKDQPVTITRWPPQERVY